MFNYKYISYFNEILFGISDLWREKLKIVRRKVGKLTYWGGMCADEMMAG